MGRSNIRTTIFVVVGSLWFAFFQFGIGPIPSPARLLDPHGGLWSHRNQVPEDGQILSGLEKAVHVAWDKAGVPHFFAQNERDLYLAQGFVMASQRLFQMDLATRQPVGRLSEWLGERTRGMDRFFVRFGMRESVAITEKDFRQDVATTQMIEPFVDGVNSWISQLRFLPSEYQVLGAKPEPFTFSRVVAMDKALSYNLSARSFATYLTPLGERLGVDVILDLFPEFLPDHLEDYVAPARVPGRRQNFESAAQFKLTGHLKVIPSFPLPNPGKGSNNWAIAPSRSKTGHAIFANDTHLRYTLPNIWYETQLHCPHFNVYGVALVSVPGIVNGFNQHIAWGPTNGTTSALDWYEVEFESETSWRYRRKEAWRDPKVIRQDVAGELVEVVWTELGPIVHREGKYGLVANWMGHKSGLELKALRGLYAAKTRQECLKSFSDHWSVPIQNFICADQNNVGIVHVGKIPARVSGEGRFIMNGNEARDTMAEVVPSRDNPRDVDPAIGFVLSANQKIVKQGFRYSLGWDYEDPFRAMAIRRRLSTSAKVSPEDMIALQNDDLDIRLEMALPLLIHFLQAETLSRDQLQILQRLKSWDGRVSAKSSEAPLADLWLKTLIHNIFKFDLPDKGFAPKTARVIWLLERLKSNPNDSDKRYLSAPLEHLVTQAFQTAFSETLGQTWSVYNKAKLTHVGRFPGWGTDLLAMNGSGTSVRGNHGPHGPVYKIVVHLKPEPEAWIQVPGGNEGEPLSVNYGRHVQDWANGQMRPVEYYQDFAEAKMRAVRILTLNPEKK